MLGTYSDMLLFGNCAFVGFWAQIEIAQHGEGLVLNVLEGGTCVDGPAVRIDGGFYTSTHRACGWLGLHN